MRAATTIAACGAAFLGAGALLLGEHPAVAPGAVSKDHATLAGACRACHEPFHSAHTSCTTCHGALVEGRGWRMLERLDEKDAATFRDLMDLATRKVRLDLNLFHLELGVSWLGVHAATVILAGLLLLIHITAVLYFGGV